jgi:hypothetical protein
MLLPFATANVAAPVGLAAEPIVVSGSWLIPPVGLLEVAARLVGAIMLPNTRPPASLSRITTRVPAALTKPPKVFKALFRITEPTRVPLSVPVLVA